MTHTKVLAGLALATALAACSDSDGNASYDDIVDRGDALIQQYGSADVTPVAAVPTAGSATYTGAAAYALDQDIDEDAGNASVLSEVRLEADFEAGSVDGEFSNFRTIENEEFDGAVAVSNGTISGNRVRGDLAGSLTAEGETTSIAGAMDAAFVGDNAEAIRGDINVREGGPGGTVVNGLFVAGAED